MAETIFSSDRPSAQNRYDVLRQDMMGAELVKQGDFNLDTKEGIAARNKFLKETFDGHAASCSSDGKIGFAALRLVGGIAAGVVLPVVGSAAVSFAGEALHQGTNVGRPLDVLKKADTEFCKMIRPPPSPMRNPGMGGGGSG